MRGSWRPNRTAIYWPPLLWPWALCLSRSPGLLNRRPGGSAFYWVLAFSTTSYHQLVWFPNSIGGPEGPFGRVWLSLPHLISNSSDLQLIWFPVLTKLYNSSITHSIAHFWIKLDDFRNNTKKKNLWGHFWEISDVHQWSRRPGFNPWSCHTKHTKNGNWYRLA